MLGARPHLFLDQTEARELIFFIHFFYFYFLQGNTWRKKIPTLEKVGKKILHRCTPEVLEKKILTQPLPASKANGPLLSRT